MKTVGENVINGTGGEEDQGGGKTYSIDFYFYRWAGQTLSSLDDREISPYSSLIAFSVDLLKVVSQFSMQSILICMKLANAGKF